MVRSSPAQVSPTKVRGGRDAILASATSNFQHLGYHGTSMRDIARDCQITVASIYHHFPSKQEILQEIMLQALHEHLAMTRAALDAAGPDPRAQLSALVRAWILFHTTRQAAAFIGATELRSLDPQGRASVIALRDQQEGIFRSVIEDGCRDGVFASAYPREATWAILNMGTAVAGWYSPNGQLSPEALAERYVGLALATVGNGA